VTGPVLEVDDLKIHFPVKAPAIKRLLSRSKPVVHAVDGVSFAIRRGEIFGLVGESGCGKTTVGRTVVRLLKPTAGRITFEGVDITNLPTLEEHFLLDYIARRFGGFVGRFRDRKAIEGHVRDSELLWSLRRRMQIIFQDPHAALNPAMTIGQAIMDPLLLHKLATPQEARDATLKIMTEVGLSPATQIFAKYPKELSGGQKQRTVIARAMVLRPSLLVADEPVAMLDMSIRARILELMLDLKRRHGLTYLFITHDLATAKLLCDRIAIMYLGKIVEVGDAASVYASPKHPYTQALLGAVPIPDPDRKRTKALPRGEVPDALNPPGGCRFHPRCPVARTDCGWDGADFIDFLERRRLTAAGLVADERGLGPISRIRAQGAIVDIPTEAGREATVREYARQLVASTSGPMAGTIASIEAGEKRVRVQFAPAQEVGFRNVEGVRVACVLY